MEGYGDSHVATMLAPVVLIREGHRVGKLAACEATAAGV